MTLPLPLQRRLSIGLGVPTGLLAGMGWGRVMRTKIQPRRRSLGRGLTIAFSALTVVFLITMASFAALSGEPWFYLSAGEWEALGWLREEAPPEAVVLCAPQTGTFVPAWAGQPVVYGHPFETLNAEWRKGQVEAYWGGSMRPAEKERFLENHRVRYVLAGPREQALGGDSNAVSESVTVALETEGVKVFEVHEY
jgi:hypothetical protein